MLEILWLIALIWLILLILAFVGVFVWVIYIGIQSWREQRAADIAGLLPDMEFNDELDSDGLPWSDPESDPVGDINRYREFYGRGEIERKVGDHEGEFDSRPDPGKTGRHEAQIKIQFPTSAVAGSRRGPKSG